MTSHHERGGKPGILKAPPGSREREIETIISCGETGAGSERVTGYGDRASARARATDSGVCSRLRSDFRSFA